MIYLRVPLIAIFLFLSQSYAFASQLTPRFHCQTTSTDHKLCTAIRDNIELIFKFVPQKMLQALSTKPIFIEIAATSSSKLSDLDKNNIATVESMFSKSEAHYNVRKNHITVSPALAEILLVPNEKTDTLFTSLGLRILARLYDHLGLTDEELAYSRKCQKRMNSIQYQPIEKECLYTIGRSKRLSSSREFLNLMLFDDTVVGFRSRQRHTFGPDKEPRLIGYNQNSHHEEELNNLEDSLALLFEKYILDQQFIYKRPATYAYFNEAFEEGRPDPVQVLFIDFTKEAPENNRWIKLDRVYGVYLNYAEPGQTLYDHWGHMDLTIVICAKHRPTVSSDCLRDVDEHLTLGFHINNNSYEKHKAGRARTFIRRSAGTFTAQITINPYLINRENYAKQGRKQFLYKLKLTKREMQKLLITASEHAYLYRGYWRDLTNNCVNQMQFLLNGVWGTFNLTESYPITTPKQFLDSMIERGLTEPQPENI